MLSVWGVCFQEQENNYCDIVKKFKKRQVQGHFFHSLSTCYRKNNFIKGPSINLIICIIYRHYDKMIPQTFSRSLFSSHLFFSRSHNEKSSIAQLSHDRKKIALQGRFAYTCEKEIKSAELVAVETRWLNVAKKSVLFLGLFYFFEIMCKK